MKSIYIKYIFFVCLGMIVSACTAVGPAFKPVERVDAKTTLVYIYREESFALGGRSAYFYINDINVFDLAPGGYSWVTLPSGIYKIKQKWPLDVSWKSIEITLEVKPGETRFYDFYTGACPVGSQPICIEWTLRSIPSDSGKRAILNKKFQPNFGLEKMQQYSGTFERILPIAEKSSGNETQKTMSPSPTTEAAIRPIPTPPASAIFGAKDFPIRTSSALNGYEFFLTHKSPRAFAISEQGGWGSAWGGIDPKARALRNCSQRAPEGECQLYMVDNSVIWSASQSNLVPH